MAQSDNNTASNKKPTDDALDDMPNYGELLTQMLVALGAIVVVLLVAAKLLPKMMGRRFAGSGGTSGGAANVIEVVETRRLDPRTTIHLVKVADQYILIGSTGDRVQTLAGGPLDSDAVQAALHRVDAGKGRETEYVPVQRSKPFAAVLKRTGAPSSE